MASTLGQVKEAARQLFFAGDYAGALRTYDQLLLAAPTDMHVRLRVADLVARLGMRDEAAELYRALGLHAISAGHPLLAIVAASELGSAGDELLRAIAATYAAGSPRLAQYAARAAPEDPERPLPNLPTQPVNFDEVVEHALHAAADFSTFPLPSATVHPVPFFSALGADELLAVLRLLRVVRARDKDLVVRQGDPGNALYLVASGELVVFTTDASGLHHELARLYAGSLFGEMALLTEQPRTASVVVSGESDIIEVSREALDRVTRQLPTLAQVLDRFARERLMKNLLSTSPLFKPFNKAQQAELLKRFEGIEYAEDSVILAEGGVGTGLFVVLSGEVEVTSAASGSEVRLAKLHSGEMFGEMSLLSHLPTMATVRSTRPSTLLFLHRDFFQRLVSAVPELRTYFEHLARTRYTDRSVKLSAPMTSVQDESPAPTSAEDVPEIEILI